MDVGVTEALAPLGVPDTARLIVPPLPTTVVEMVLEPLVPCTRLRLPGLAEIVKFGLGAVTVSCTVVGWVTDPSVPVTVSEIGRASCRARLKFRVVRPAVQIEGGMKSDVAPLRVTER